MHYKPGTRKYAINMLRDGHFNFIENIYSIIEDQLLKMDMKKRVMNARLKVIER